MTGRRRGLFGRLGIVCFALCCAWPWSAAVQRVEAQQGTIAADARALLREAQAVLAARKTDEAARLFQRALEAARGESSDTVEADALIALARIANGGDRHDDARRYAAAAAVVSDRLGDARLSGRAHYLIGAAERGLDHGAAAASAYAIALERFEQAGDRGGISEAQLGLVLSQTLAVTEEQALLATAAAHARAVGDANLVAQALHLWSDRLFVAGEYERALATLQEAETAAMAGSNLDRLGTIYNSFGRLYRNHGQIEPALGYQRKALALHERDPGSFFHVQSLNAVAVTYQALGDHANARTYLNRALQIAMAGSTPRVQDFIRANLVTSLTEQEAYQESARVLEGVIARKLDVYPHIRYSDLAAIYMQLGRLDAALDAANQAVQICGAREDAPCFAARDRRAQVLLASGDRAGALEDLQAGAAMLERIRARLVPADFFRQQFGRAQIASYGRRIEIELAEGQPGAALETAELARSRAFLDLLASRSLETPNLPLAARAATTADLIALANRLGSTLLVYWVTPDRLFIWTVAPSGGIRSATVAVRESKLAQLVKRTAPLEPASGNVWRELYDLLIQPVRDSLPAAPGALVTIIPHGPLTMLPFAALQNDRRRYLLEDYTLHYTPAGAVLAVTAGQRRHDARSTPTLVVANPSFTRKSTLDPLLPALPGSLVEARAVARLAMRDQVTVLRGAGATEAGVRSETAGKGVLHFATHAIISDADPFESFLALGAASGGPDDDGALTAQEIYSLKLDAEVVVLSACRSGGGRVTGDGLATFARAFIYAGAPSLITSVWDVADESAAQLLPEFYRAWRGGAAKAAALRTAQLAFLRRLRQGSVKVETVAGLVSLPEDPALWAGFTLIGEPD